MADHDEDDLFADLYENEEAPVAAAPVASAPAPAEPQAAANQTDSAPAAEEPVYTETIANGSNETGAYDQNQQDSNYGNGGANQGQDYDMSQGQGYEYNNNNNSNNQGNDQGAQHHDEEDYKPIGIKEDGKMFIGGLNWETTDQSLRDYFSQFGEVVECTVMRDGATGRSRGFGFLTFRDPKTVNIVMVKEHQLDGKIIDPKRAIPRDEQERTSKIFVGGVSQEATEQDFKNFFMQFGRVLDATLMMDKDTGRPRGFGFVTFDSEAAVDRTLERPLEILGKYIEVKKAQPRGNIRDDDNGGGRFSKHNKFGGAQGGGQGGGFDNQGAMGGQNAGGMAGGANQGMSPAMMAQYWQRMQQYFQVMQQQMAANMGGGGMNPMMGGGQPNPAMMQQMMAMQGGMGRGQGDMQNMNPAAMQQMQQMAAMQQMQQQQQQQPNQQQAPINAPSGPGSSASASGASPMNGGPGARPGYTAQEQMAFEQQKYERQLARGSSGGPTSWEGMYDDAPPPGGPAGMNMNMGGGMGGGMGGRGGFRGRGGRGRGGYGGYQGGYNNNNDNGSGSTTPQAQAPAGAPTGPKNAGKPGANYRGGGRGGHRGFHPYARGGG